MRTRLSLNTSPSDDGRNETASYSRISCPDQKWCFEVVTNRLRAGWGRSTGVELPQLNARGLIERVSNELEIGRSEIAGRTSGGTSSGPRRF